MDIFEHLILIMIIRREIINFAINKRHYELLGAINEKNYFLYTDIEQNQKRELISPETEGLYTHMNTQEFKNSNENYRLDDEAQDRSLMGSPPIKVVPMTPKNDLNPVLI